MRTRYTATQGLNRRFPWLALAVALCCPLWLGCLASAEDFDDPSLSGVKSVIPGKGHAGAAGAAPTAGGSGAAGTSGDNPEQVLGAPPAMADAGSGSACNPTRCSEVGATCGQLPDGCGNVLSCGTCAAGAKCVGNQCECIPFLTCLAANAQCGTLDDGCGGTECGSCQGGATCKNHQCCFEQEFCGNGKDDDCDGVVDEGCKMPTCVHHCNDYDDGSGKNCAPVHNVYGCSPEMFQEFCTRKVKPGGYDHWDAYIEQWVDERCDGVVTGDGKYYETFSCTDSYGRTWSCQTPLVLAFGGVASIAYAPVAPPFRLGASGGAVAAAWPAASSPWLAIDRNGDGAITDGSELFGSAYQLADGQRARHGFEALAELDTDQDGVLDRSDAGWAHLLVWRDFDADGVSAPEELSGASEEGLLAIALRYEGVRQCDALDRCMGERAEFLWTSITGETRRGTVVDLYLPSRTE